MLAIAGGIKLPIGKPKTCCLKYCIDLNSGSRNFLVHHFFTLHIRRSLHPIISELLLCSVICIAFLLLGQKNFLLLEEYIFFLMIELMYQARMQRRTPKIYIIGRSSKSDLCILRKLYILKAWSLLSIGFLLHGKSMNFYC